MIDLPNSANNSIPQIPAQLRDGSQSDRLRYLRARVGARVLSFTCPLPPLGENGFGIINYHRVHPQKGLPISVTPVAFERQISGLLRHGYQPYTVEGYRRATEAGVAIPRKAFAITFDDAFDSVREYALPILKRLGVPASVYLVTSCVGAKNFPFDPLVYEGVSDAADDVVRPLSVDGCSELLAAGWEIGAHTHTHRDFVGHPGVFATDLRQSVEWLKRQFGISQPTFSFPYGGLDEDLREICRESAVTCALTTECRLVMPGDDPYDWGRLGAEDYDTGATLVAKLNGWHTTARLVWRRLAYGESTGWGILLRGEADVPVDVEIKNSGGVE